MTLNEAKKIVGPRRPRWEIKAMVKALSLHPWLNTPKEDKRLEAGKIVLTNNWHGT